jgi:hypothetical protein
VTSAPKGIKVQLNTTAAPVEITPRHGDGDVWILAKEMRSIGCREKSNKAGQEILGSKKGESMTL